MGYSIWIKVWREDGRDIGAEPARWATKLTRRLSKRSEPVVFEPDDDAIIAIFKPGGDRDIDRAVEAGEAFRASHPDLVIEMGDDFCSDLIPPPALPPADGPRCAVTAPHPDEVIWEVQPPQTVADGLRLPRGTLPGPHIHEFRCSPTRYDLSVDGDAPPPMCIRYTVTAYDEAGDEVWVRERMQRIGHLVDPEFSRTIQYGWGDSFDPPPLRPVHTAHIALQFAVARRTPCPVVATRRGATWTFEVDPPGREVYPWTGIAVRFFSEDDTLITEAFLSGRDDIGGLPEDGAYIRKKRVPGARRVEACLLGAVYEGGEQHVTVSVED